LRATVGKRGNGTAPGNGNGALQPSAFTTQKLVEEAAAEAIALGELSNCCRNFHGESSHVTRRLVVVRFHTPFWRRVEAQRRKQKTISPGAEEMANHRERLLTDSPTG